jgi:hypothetical protein
MRIAEELLVREVLDAEQVRRLAAGESLEDAATPAAPVVEEEDAARQRPKERPLLVPPLPLKKPLPQE